MSDKNHITYTTLALIIAFVIGVCLVRGFVDFFMLREIIP